MWHCKHQWQECTGVLREVFGASERRSHTFYVCSRCLRIDEVPDAPARLALQPTAPTPVAEPKREAA